MLCSHIISSSFLIFCSVFLIHKGFLLNLYISIHVFLNAVSCVYLKHFLPIVTVLIQSLSYTPLYVHVCPGHREISAYFQATFKFMCNFITEYQGCIYPAMKIGMHIIL